MAHQSIEPLLNQVQVVDPWDDHNLLLGRIAWYLYIQIKYYVYAEDQSVDMKINHHHLEMPVDNRNQEVVDKGMANMIICIRMLQYVYKKL